MKHTPGPWHVGMKPGPMIYDQNGDQIADMHDPLPCIDNLVNKANAAFIVRACNSHDDLLAALNELLGWETTAPQKYIEQARAAIAKAEQS